MDMLLTTEQVADRFQVSKRTVERWRESGEGPAFIRIMNRKYRYRPADCDAWALANRQTELQS